MVNIEIIVEKINADAINSESDLYCLVKMNVETATGVMKLATITFLSVTGRWKT